MNHFVLKKSTRQRSITNKLKVFIQVKDKNFFKTLQNNLMFEKIKTNKNICFNNTTKYNVDLTLPNAFLH